MLKLHWLWYLRVGHLPQVTNVNIDRYWCNLGYVFPVCVFIMHYNTHHVRRTLEDFHGFVFMPTISEENVIVSESVLLYVPRISCSALSEMFKILETGRCLVHSDINKTFPFHHLELLHFLMIWEIISSF